MGQWISLLILQNCLTSSPYSIFEKLVKFYLLFVMPSPCVAYTCSSTYVCKYTHTSKPNCLSHLQWRAGLTNQGIFLVYVCSTISTLSFQIPPPWIPDVANDLDTKYIPEEFTHEAVSLTPPNDSMGEDIDQPHFAQFSFHGSRSSLGSYMSISSMQTWPRQWVINGIF